jgi:hypothetical protein
MVHTVSIATMRLLVHNNFGDTSMIYDRCYYTSSTVHNGYGIILKYGTPGWEGLQAPMTN